MAVVRRSCAASLLLRRSLHSSRPPAQGAKRGGDRTVDLSAYDTESIRNFSIVAHVDHGKSTLADRLLEVTGTLPASPSNQQVLDSLPVERERGITVKAQTASMFYRFGGRDYLLNLIDTPGHVDFSYEVSRALSACQGVILLVDATQGVQAQTVSTHALASAAHLVVIPTINKIDLPGADVVGVAHQIANAFSADERDILTISAKTGQKVPQLLEEVIKRTPSPSGSRESPPRILLVDSWYEPYRGVVCLVSVLEGRVGRGQRVVSAHTGVEYEVQDMGILRPQEVRTSQLSAGHVGYLVLGMRDPKEACVGDTFGEVSSTPLPRPSFRQAQPVVFAGIFPTESADYEGLRSSLAKLSLNDPSVNVEPDSSAALGQGWRAGFRGLLHLEIFIQRLEQEYNTSCLVTTPSVTYQAVLKKDGHLVNIRTPSEFPDPSLVAEYREPMIAATIVTPDHYLGKVMELAMSSRGSQQEVRYIGPSRAMLRYHLPLSEVIVDFYSKLKSLSSGYASFDYEECGHAPANLVKLDILLNGTPVDVLSAVVHRDSAYTIGRAACQRLQSVIHRQLYEVVIQAAIGSKVIARETVRALRKDVTAKCYGGDISRKRKLLERQKEGKKRLKRLGRIELPKDAFLSVLKRRS